MSPQDPGFTIGGAGLREHGDILEAWKDGAGDTV